jgi:tellurium resistance protein TerD
MPVKLAKGGNLSLSKAEPGLEKVVVGLGWTPRVTTGKEFDLDASLFMLTATGKVRSDDDFIFYNQPASTEGSVVHGGDNRTGAGDGDDETITIELANVPEAVQRLSVCVTIHEADQRRQNFGMVSDAYVRVVNAETNAEIARYDLSEDASVETAMIFGEVYRHAGEWKFRAVGQGFSGGLAALASNFGVDVG